MVGHLGYAQPVPPRLAGRNHSAGRLFGGRDWLVTPRKRYKGALAFLEVRAPDTARADRPESKATGERQGEITTARAHLHVLVAVALILEGARDRPVLETGDTIDGYVNAPIDADGRPQECAGRDGVAGRTFVGGPPPTFSVWSHDQDVVDNEPAGRGVPGCFEHHGAWDIAAVLGHCRVV